MAKLEVSTPKEFSDEIAGIDDHHLHTSVSPVADHYDEWLHMHPFGQQAEREHSTLTASSSDFERLCASSNVFVIIARYICATPLCESVHLAMPFA